MLSHHFNITVDVLYKHNPELEGPFKNGIFPMGHGHY